jgi:hypothetical protein
MRRSHSATAGAAVNPSLGERAVDEGKCYWCRTARRDSRPLCTTCAHKAHRRQSYATPQGRQRRATGWRYAPSHPFIRIFSRCTISKQGCWLYDTYRTNGRWLGVSVNVSMGPLFPYPDGRHRTMAAPRAVLTMLTSSLGTGMICARLCGQPRCCRPSHLEWQSRAQWVNSPRSNNVRAWLTFANAQVWQGKTMKEAGRLWRQLRQVARS